jgi:hypothetical protein
MRQRDPNAREPIEPLNDKARYTEVSGSVDGSNEPGYRRLGRRPRVTFEDECQSLEKAERYEQIAQDMQNYPDDYYGY